ncbi:MAG: type II toxin-antitoxin system MqsA family antitoxin [Deltaproteobacteria bacterium]|nr:type II toxin-antitoxin system MqsA family antitoxin [Deltaproteobacteria bacterium]
MNCPNCKSEMICTLDDYQYIESGLDNVYLVGIEIHKCSCGEEIINLPAVAELHTLIALNLIKKKSSLNGNEIRFLRKNLGLTAKKLGEIIGIDNATISRWEKGSQLASNTHDRFLRLLYLNIKDIPPEEIRTLIQEDFVSISPGQVETPPFIIPREKWSKTDICFPEAP